MKFSEYPVDLIETAYSLIAPSLTVLDYTSDSTERSLALVSYILGDCPGCGACQSFGNIDVRGSFISQGCGCCKYHSRIPLPPVKKKLLYLDQFFFSHAFRGNEPQFLEAAERIRTLAAKQLLVAPYSTVHEDETKQWEHYDELLDFVKATSRGHEFSAQFNVEHTQLYKAFEAFLRGEPVAYVRARDDILEDDIDRWDGYFRIDVPRFQRDRDDLKAAKKRLFEGLVQLFPRWRASTNKFEDDVWLEDHAAGRQYLARYAEYVQRLVEGDFAVMVNGHVDSLVMETLLRFVPGNVPRLDAMKLIVEFFTSDHFREIPHRYVASRMFATLKKLVKEGAYQNAEVARGKLSGFYSDVDHIATYAPYCDAFLMDRAMAEMVNRPTVALSEKYGVKVFSRGNWNEMHAWFDELEATVTAEHQAALEAAYPTTNFVAAD
ncbi:hypothetical protein GFL21_17900 [Rhizobium anhuiense]|nr:hypothetical protein [Rhizobium anhuiense]